MLVAIANPLRILTLVIATKFNLWQIKIFFGTDTLVNAL